MKTINTAIDLRKFKVADGDYNIRATYANRFFLFKNKDYVEVILDEELLNKKVKIYIEDKLIFYGILDTTSLFILNVNYTIDMDKLADNIKIIEEV